MKRIALQRNSSSRSVDRKSTDASAKQAFVDNRPVAGKIAELKKVMQDATVQRKATQLQLVFTPNTVTQFAWGDGDSPNDILQKLTGKTVAQFQNNRGQAFETVTKVDSSQGILLILNRAGSETHVTIPVKVNEVAQKYELRDTVHITGLFNSGTAEAPKMTEWVATYDLTAGKMATDAQARKGKEHKFIRRPSLDEGVFLMESKVKKDGKRRPNAVGDLGNKFTRRPSSASLALTAATIPKVE